MDQNKNHCEPQPDEPVRHKLDRIQAAGDDLEELRTDPEVSDEDYVRMRYELRHEVGRVAAEYGPDDLPGKLPDLP